MIDRLIEVRKGVRSVPTGFRQEVSGNLLKWVKSLLGQLKEYEPWMRAEGDTEQDANEIVTRMKDTDREAVYVAAFVFKKLNLIKRLFEQKQEDLDMVFRVFNCAMVFKPGRTHPLQFVPLLMDYLEVAARDIPRQPTFVFVRNELFSLLKMDESMGFSTELVTRVMKFFCWYRPLTAMMNLAFLPKVVASNPRGFNRDLMFGCSIFVFNEYTFRSPQSVRESIMWVLNETTDQKEQLMYGYIYTLLRTRNHDELLAELLVLFSNIQPRFQELNWFMQVFEDTVHPPSPALVHAFAQSGYKLKRFPLVIPPGIEYKMDERKKLLWLIHTTNLPVELIRDHLFKMLC